MLVTKGVEPRRLRKAGKELFLRTLIMCKLHKSKILVGLARDGGFLSGKSLADK